MTRYEYGGDEFIFVELSEEMTLQANFRGQSHYRGTKGPESAGNRGYLSGQRFIYDSI